MRMTEPMLLGSPSFSPQTGSSPGSHHSTHHSPHNATLPPYLMGENMPSPTFLRKIGNTSPAKHNLHRPHHLLHHSPGHSPLERSPTRLVYRRKRVGGPPPTHGLFESSFHVTPERSLKVEAANRAWNTSVSGSTHGHDSSIGPPPMPPAPPINTSLSFDPTAPLNSTQFVQGLQSNSMCYEDPPPDAQEAECWVTVFGFQPAAASYVLQQFSQCGSILHHQVSCDGNWMHLRYKSKMQAKRALSKNGKVFCSNMMIGVVACADVAVIEQYMGDPTDPTIEMEFVQEPVAVAHGPPTDNSQMDESIRGGMRSLTASYKQPSRFHQLATTKRQEEPLKRAGIVSKAMEYVFGW